jgi:SAM-dependent methyltransferase
MAKLSEPGRVMPVQAKQVAEWIVWTTTRRSSGFWDLHYRARGTSGPGSRGEAAAIKAREVNRIVAANDVQSVVEFGCGDGYQLGLLSIPQYIGLDISPNVLRRCIREYGSDRSKSFLRYDPSCWSDNLGVVHADMALSMDVILHLVEDEVFEQYMSDLFAVGDRFVLVYSHDGPGSERTPCFTRYRRFSDWVTTRAPGWRLSERVEDPVGTGAHLHLFARGPCPIE